MVSNEVYRRFLDDELALDEAAELLRVASNAEAGSLRLDSLPDAQREKAARLLDAAIRPILAPYFAGEVGREVTARRLVPLVRPLGVYALNVDVPTGPRADEVMARLMELTERLADLEDASEGRE